LAAPLVKVASSIGAFNGIWLQVLPNDGTSKAAIPEAKRAVFRLCVELLVFFCFVSLWPSYANSCCLASCQTRLYSSFSPF
jgi:hypothetical protein